MDHQSARAELALDASFAGKPRCADFVRGRPGKNDRPAMPAGHPITWGAITDGTVIDGAVYPFPVFADADAR